MGSDLYSAVEIAAQKIGVPFAALGAVVEVESAGVYYAKVNGRNEPLIRWEGHYFHRILKAKSAEKLRIAEQRGLANARAGAVANPSSQQARWDRLLGPAMDIDVDAALQSCSWGVGQVMGANYRDLRFTSVNDLVNACRSGLEGQVDVMCRFIVANGLVDELRAANFAGFARVYNGPNYRRYEYDTKMEAAYRRWGGGGIGGKAIDPMADGMLRLGEKGAAIREMQQKLQRAGYPLKADGDFGTATRDAVRAFQKSQKLAVDGIAGPLTLARLDMLTAADDAVEADETVVRNGAAGTAAGVSAGIAGGSLQEVIDTAQGTVAAQALQTGSQVLIWAGLALAMIGLGLTVYGIIRKGRRTARLPS